MRTNINRGNLVQNKKIEKYKVRAIIKTEDNLFLVINYDGVYLFPGGKVEKGENLVDAIKRELYEELGINYKSTELGHLINMHHNQSNYPERDGTVTDRVVNTTYFIAPYKDLNLEKTQLTDAEKAGNFKIEFLTEEELNNIINSKNCKNPRNKFFMQELDAILKVYKSKTDYKGLQKTLK